MPYGPPCGHTSIILGLSKQHFQKRAPNTETDALSDAIQSASAATVLLHGCAEYCRVLSSCLPSHSLRFIGEGPSGIVSTEGRGETYLQNVVSGFGSLSTTQEYTFGTLESLESAFSTSVQASGGAKCDEEEEVFPENGGENSLESELKPPPAKRRGPRKKLFKQDLLQQQQHQHQRAILGSTVFKGEEGSTAISSRRRVILVLPLDKGVTSEKDLELHTLADGSVVDVRKVFNDVTNLGPKTSCDLFVVRVATTPSACQTPQIASLKERSLVNLDEFPTYMTNLAAQQCCLMKVIVSGINIRMFNSNSATIGSNDTLCAPGTATFWAHGFPEHALTAPIGMDIANKKQVELILRWEQPCDSLASVPAPDSLPCSCIHRATPAYSGDPVSQMLWSHVLSGKSVLLGTGTSKFTHTLQMHANGVVYLHCCRDMELALSDSVGDEDGPAVFDCTRSKNYSTRDFFELIDSNLLFYKKTLESVTDLVPVTISGVDGPTFTPVLAERYTRFFPWDDKQSIIQGKETYEELKNLLDQIRKVVTLPKIDPPALVLGKYSFEKLAECATSNNSRLFPPMRSSSAARKKAYQKLCEEVYLFVQSCDTTPEHHKLVEILEGLIPPELFDCKKASLGQPPKVIEHDKREHTLTNDNENSKSREDENKEKANKKTLFGDSDSLLSIFWDF